MICSAPPGKSGSNWLDRLRSNKGIPTGDDMDLDSFLATHSLHSNPDPILHTRARNRTRASETHDPPMSSVLAELFNMGGSLSQGSKLPGKKYPRKQTNPKFFVASSSSNSSIDDVPAVNSVNSDVVAAEEEAVVGGDQEQKDNENEDDKDGDELRGFSRSEVTMIDTSCPGWKLDKLVFRKNNVWKIGERKAKSKFFAKKKRKGTVLARGFGINGGGGGVGVENKPAVLEYQVGIGNSAETSRGQFITPSTQLMGCPPNLMVCFKRFCVLKHVMLNRNAYEGQYAQHERRKACKDTQDDLMPSPKNEASALASCLWFLIFLLVL